jgi:hypothetical protein
MADKTFAIDADTESAVEAMNELRVEFDNTLTAAQRMEGGMGEAARAMSEFEREALRAKKQSNALAAGMESGTKSTKGAVAAKGLDSAAAGKLTADYGKLAGTLAMTVPGFDQFAGILESTTGKAGEMGGALGAIGLAAGGSLLALEAFRFALDQIYGEMQDLKNLANELDQMPFFREEKWRSIAEAIKQLRDMQTDLARIVETGTDHQDDWLDTQMSLSDTLRRREEREAAEEERRAKAAVAAAAANKARIEATRQLAELLAGMDEVDRLDAEVRAELRREEVLKQIAETEIDLHNDTMRRREEEAAGIAAMMQQAIDLERQLREERDESEARLQAIGQTTADYASQGIALTQSLIDINQQEREGEISAAQARKMKGAEFLKEFSRHMTLKGLEQVALVPASYPNIPEMAAHGAAAGLFFAAAGAAGAGGRKLASNAGKQEADRREGGGGGRAPRAEGGGGGGGGVTMITINAPFATRSEAAVAMDEAMRARARQTRGGGGGRG